MQRSDFILTIKKETDKLVEAWNNGPDSANVYKHITNIEILVCLYRYLDSHCESDLRGIDKRLSDASPLRELVETAVFYVDLFCMRLQSSGLSDDAKAELSKSIEVTRLELQNLPIPAELR